MQNHHELIDLILEKRGILKDMKEFFLKPSYERDLSDPFLMHDMEKAVVRVFEAIESKQKVVIYSDYDCDGIPGAVVLHDLFKKIGFTNFTNYIPHRHDEGYGLHMDAINQFEKESVNLIITIDLGITAVAEVAHATAWGIDVIVTDHHEPLAELPRAYALVNPKINMRHLSPEGDSAESDPMLCGAGVIFRFVQAFIQKYGEYYKIPKGWEKWLLDMVAIATLSDMVPLQKENRVLASFGLQVLSQTKRPGLRELCALMKTDLRHITEDDVTFMIAPRLNAASRMASPQLAFDLLSETDPARARAIAEELSRINDDRKYLVASVMKEARQALSKREDKQVIVVGSPKWQVGILGLVAGKLVEEYQKPVFVWGGHDENCFKGSCRSIGNSSVVSLMQSLPASTLLSFGGHEMAGGFSIAQSEIHFLEERLIDVYVKSDVGAQEKKEAYAIDADITLSLLSRNIYDTLDELAPFGVGNAKPTFVCKSVTVGNVKQFGKTKEHLELQVTDGNGVAKKAIAFFATPESYPCIPEIGKKIDLVATLERSWFLGREELRLRIVDIQATN